MARSNDKLTAKQARFVQEYLIDRNATQAAIRAGYSERSARQIGEKNLRNPLIAAAIKEAEAKITERNLVSQDMVIQGLLDEAKFFGEGTAHSARVSAWEKLGKHLGMFKEKIDHTSSDGSMSPSQAASDAVLEALAKKYDSGANSG